MEKSSSSYSPEIGDEKMIFLSGSVQRSIVPCCEYIPIENILNNTFKEIEDITDVHQMTNQQLKRLIQKIEVDKEGNVDIYLRLLGDLGLDESVLIEENETILNCNDQT